MKIKSIVLKNFRQFKGEQKVEFSTASDSNVTVILGENTSGKTTLLQAFLWCLYGKSNFKSKHDLLNDEVIFDASNREYIEEEIAVTLNILHQDMEYTIIRKQKFSITNGRVKPNRLTTLKVFYKEKDGQTEEIEQTRVGETVQNILPEGLSPYFFYDTESFGNVGSKEDITSAVKELLGLTLLENIKNHIGRETQSTTVLGILNSSLSTKDESAAKDAREKFEQAEEDILKIERFLKQAEDEKNKYELKIQTTQEKLKDMESVAQLQLQKELKEKEEQEKQKEITRQEKNYLKTFNKNTFLIFLEPLIEQAFEKLNDANVSDKGIKNMHANSIKHIIERGQCVCGTPITESTEAYEQLLNELEYLPPKSIGLMINNFKSTLNAWSTVDHNHYESIVEIYTTILRNKKGVDILEEEIKRLSNRIKENEGSKVLEEDLQKYKGRINKLDDDIVKYNRQIGSLNQVINENKRIYQSLLGASEKNEEIKEQMAYAEEIYSWVDKRFSTKESEIRFLLEEKVNEYFQEIYHGNRKVEIDDKYRVNLITVAGEENLVTDESRGLETVKNFSFIAGLVDLAKSKILEDIDSDSEAYPLVLDAPFSNADSTHVTNISKVLPEVAEQLILVVMSKDWDHADKEIGNKVGRRYKIDKKSEIHSVITEV